MRRFAERLPKIRAGRPGASSQKPAVRGLSATVKAVFSDRRTAWLGREDSNSKPDALACPRGFAELHFIGIHKQLETLEFREPYRIRGVQSSGEN
jgi:hypothetical protein